MEVYLGVKNMITKDEFIQFIESYQEFDSAVERISKAIVGKHSWSIDLFESDWFMAVGKMLDIFLKSHFTDDGVDMITWWMFEDVDHIVWQQVEPTLFDDTEEIKYNLKTIDDLWDYLMEYKENYVK